MSSAPDVQVSRGAKLLVLAVALLLAVVLAEVALRIFWRNPFGENSSRMIVELQTQMKDGDRRIDRTVINAERPHVAFRTDSRGYIRPSIRFPKPDHTVLFLGGSTTECMFVHENLRFPAHASFVLERRGLKVNTLNLGVSGNDSHQSLNNLLNYAVDDRPNVAVLMHAANDIGHLRAWNEYTSAMGQSPSLRTLGRLLLTKGSSRSSLLALVRHTSVRIANRRALAGHGTADPNLLRLDERQRPLPVEKFKQRLRAFVGICHAFGIQPVLMTQPSERFRNELTPGWINQSDQALFNQAIRDVASEQRVELIDLVAHLRTRRTPTPIFYDGIHLTDDGSRMYGEHVAERLEQILRKANEPLARRGSGSLAPAKADGSVSPLEVRSR